ncbi:nucleolar transcription factor 1-like [Archocentrus centrarchus]|uniref:nucleolar transcription factor 1-like n=1 Tax=Archocentrus centrarchus TaxID=63155 RepID=UPI0011E9FFCF|nr:nucleolar transcription factor 1-like [Archocentrus centrarchus]
MSEKEDVPKKSCVSEWSQRWRNLSEKERRAYITRCKELKNQYSTKLRDYLKGFEKDEQQQILHENKLKMPVMQKISNKTYKELLPGEPKKAIPRDCAYLSFWQEQMELLKEEIPNVRNRFAVDSEDEATDNSSIVMMKTRTRDDEEEEEEDDVMFEMYL